MFVLTKTLLAEKDKHIARLESEVAFLRRLVQPNSSPNSIIINTEADAVLTGHQEQIPVEEDADVLNERDRVLSGNY